MDRDWLVENLPKLLIGILDKATPCTELFLRFAIDGAAYKECRFNVLGEAIGDLEGDFGQQAFSDVLKKFPAIKTVEDLEQVLNKYQKVVEICTPLLDSMQKSDIF